MELSEWIIEYGPSVALAIGAFFGVVILFAVAFAASALAGTKAVEYGKLLVAEIRGQRLRIIAAVDEDSDKIPSELAKLVPGVWDDKLWSALLLGAVKVILAEKEAAAKVESTPRVELGK